jgi:hypothetical protein
MHTLEKALHTSCTQGGCTSALCIVSQQCRAPACITMCCHYLTSLQGPCYTPAWRPHVLSHLPFYTVLIPKFLELIYARLSFRGDAAAAELPVLMRGLAQGGPDLLKELEAVEGAYNRCGSEGACSGGACNECRLWSVMVIKRGKAVRPCSHRGRQGPVHDELETVKGSVQQVRLTDLGMRSSIRLRVQPSMPCSRQCLAGAMHAPCGWLGCM